MLLNRLRKKHYIVLKFLWLSFGEIIGKFQVDRIIYGIVGELWLSSWSNVSQNFWTAVSFD